jgi:hypothetical protein
MNKPGEKLEKSNMSKSIEYEHKRSGWEKVSRMRISVITQQHLA